jgi:5-(carboxyamino)imidazole ribonucleotide synthase
MIGPGGTIGILGGGQLGWMLALEAQRMGYRTLVLDPSMDCSASRIADKLIVASFDNEIRSRELASKSDVVTLEFERVSHRIYEALEAQHTVHPPSYALLVIQDRMSQRVFIRTNNMPQPEFALISSAGELDNAAKEVGFPAIMKIARGGYDGKNQARVSSAAELAEAWHSFGKERAVLERFVKYQQEISVVLARTEKGEVRAFPVAENQHRDHILFLTVAPARVPDAIQARAVEIATGLAHALNYVGVMAVEMFVEDGEVLINEIAPRVHNSGHYTLGACATSQFEQHIRAVCGVPLGDVAMPRPAAMLNLLGDVWHNGEPQWEKFYAEFPSARLFLYGKEATGLRRKMGHITFLGHDTADEAEAAALRAYELLKG